MHMLLANRKVCTQIWPSTQLSDDLSGALEYVSVAWPGYLECRHVPGPSQTLPSQHACCLLLWPGGRTWEGQNFGHQQAWRCEGWPLCCWGCSESLGIHYSGHFHCLCEDPWFSGPLTASPTIWFWPQHPQGEHHTFSCVLSLSTASRPGGPLFTGGSRGALLQIILLYSAMAFNLQIFTWHMMGRCSFVSYKRGTCDQHLWTGYLFLYFFGPRSNYF